MALIGLLCEGARTQIIAATADIRDMTTANWALGATMTRARTSVGADGAANSATRLTGGAVAATNTCYYTVTAAASSRTYSAFVKRVTGTGPVRIVQTGTETDISSQINSSTYTRVQLTASVLNVAIGFKIDTSTDAIDVDFNQFEAGAFASSPISVGGATRAADVLTYASASNVSGTVGSAYAEFDVTSDTDTNSNVIISSDVANRLFLYCAAPSNGNVRMWDGTNAPSAINAPTTGVRKGASAWGGSSLQTAHNGTVSTATGFTGNVNVTALVNIGQDSAGANHFYGNLRNVRLWSRALSSSELASVTAG